MQIEDGRVASEEWRAVVGYEGVYEVSDLGRVRSRASGHVLSPTRDKDGYPVINLYGPEARRTWAVHRLVASAFHGDRRNPVHREVAHLDGDRTNARADNLKWCSKVENHSHMRAHGTAPVGSRNGRAKLTLAQVREIKAAKGTRINGELGRKYGVHKDTIGLIRRGRIWRDA